MVLTERYEFPNLSNLAILFKQYIPDECLGLCQVLYMESGTDTLHLNTPLGFTETSRDTSEKKHPVWNVTLDTSD